MGPPGLFHSPMMMVALEIGLPQRNFFITIDWREHFS